MGYVVKMQYSPFLAISMIEVVSGVSLCYTTKRNHAHLFGVWFGINIMAGGKNPDDRKRK